MHPSSAKLSTIPRICAPSRPFATPKVLAPFNLLIKGLVLFDFWSGPFWFQVELPSATVPRVRRIASVVTTLA